MNNKGEIIDKILNDCIPKTNKIRDGDRSYPPPNNPTCSDIINWNLFGTYTNLDLGSIVAEMIESRMIEERGINLHTIKLGYEILSFGGYDKYVKHEKLKRTKEYIQYKLLWPSFIITLISVGFSIFFGIKNQGLADKQDLQSKQIQTVESRIDSIIKIIKKPR